MRTGVITIPAMTIPVGQFSRTTNNPIPSDADNVQIKVQQQSWTHTGELVWTWSIDYAADGVNFVSLALPKQVFNTAVPEKFGQPADQEELGVNIPDVGLTTRKLRFNIDCVEAQQISGGTLDVF